MLRNAVERSSASESSYVPKEDVSECGDAAFDSKSPPGSNFSSPKSNTLLRRKRVGWGAKAKTQAPISTLQIEAMGIMSKSIGGENEVRGEQSPVGDFMSSPMSKSLLRRKQLRARLSSDGFSTPDSKEKRNDRLRARHMQLVKNAEAAEEVKANDTVVSDDSMPRTPGAMARLLLEREAAFRSRESCMKREIDRLQARLTAIGSSTSAPTPMPTPRSHPVEHDQHFNGSPIDAALHAANLEDEDVTVFSDLFSYQSIELSKMKQELERTRDEIESMRGSLNNSWIGSPASSVRDFSPLVQRAETVRVAEQVIDGDIPPGVSSLSSPPAPSPPLRGSSTILQHLKSPSDAAISRSLFERSSAPAAPVPKRTPPRLPAGVQHAMTPEEKYAELQRELDEISASWGKQADFLTSSYQ